MNEKQLKFQIFDVFVKFIFNLSGSYGSIDSQFPLSPDYEEMEQSESFSNHEHR